VSLRYLRWIYRTSTSICTRLNAVLSYCSFYVTYFMLYKFSPLSSAMSYMLVLSRAGILNRLRLYTNDIFLALQKSNTAFNPVQRAPKPSIWKLCGI
jgi:hypothetical protein